jgi:transposase
MENEHDMIVPAEYIVTPTVCVRCGVVDPRLKKHGVQEQLFMDTPNQGKRVGIRVRRQRYKCYDCGGTFQQELPDMDDKRHMTKRLVRYVERRSIERTFTEVATDIGVDEKTVRNIFNEYVGELNASYWPLTPNYIGMDELFLLGKARCIFTNVMDRTIMDLLPYRDKATVTAWLVKRQLRELVEVATMDMWPPYRDASLEALPNAIVVVDHFHVVKKANEALDKVRRTLRDGLDKKGRSKLLRSKHLILRRRRDLDEKDFAAMQAWTDAVPVLFAAYNAKEDFFDLYEYKTKQEAMEYYEMWKATIDPLAAAAFAELMATVENWKPEIFNYFEYPVTNAYTEGVNRVAKGIAHLGRGYSFDAIRAKVLFGQAKHIKRPKFGEGELTDLGVSMPHLVEALNANH